MRTTTIKRWLAVLMVATGLGASAAQADNINVVLGVTNPFPAPTTFAFTVTASTLLSGLVSFSATLGAQLVDGNQNGASLAPVGGFILQGLINGIAVGNDSLGTVTASFLPTGVFSGTYNCGGPCNNFGLLFNFILSPFDSATLTASFTVNEARSQVPEPAPWQLLALILALCAVTWRLGMRPATTR